MAEKTMWEQCIIYFANEYGGIASALEAYALYRRLKAVAIRRRRVKNGS